VLAGVIVAVLVLATGRVEGGWPTVWSLGWQHGKFAMFDARFDLTSRANLYSACAYGMFVYFSVAVTSQSAVQRYASMPSIPAARRLLAVNGIGTALVCLLFFLLGSVMFAFYWQQPAGDGSIFPPLPRKDQLTMYFVRTELATPGLIGLLLGALFATVMGSISSGLNALSAVVVCDWYPSPAVGIGPAER
jgi:Na+/proline symporter